MPLQSLRLPIELIREILDHYPTDNLSNLATLCLVNSAVRSWVRPALYRTVRLATRKQFTSFAHSCANTGGGEHTITLLLALSEPLPSGELDELLQCLPKLANFRIAALDMRNVTQTHSTSRLYLAGNLHGSNWQRGAAVAPRVTHLFVEDPYCPNTLILGHVTNLFPSLTHLGFVTRPFELPLLVRFVRQWLTIPTLQRLAVFMIYYDAHESLRWFPLVWAGLQTVQDARLYVYAVSATAFISEQPMSGIRRARLAGAALGCHTVLGKLDVWRLGTCVVANAASES